MTKKEIKELNEYIGRYRQKSIQSLAKKRDGLFEEVDGMKLKEKKFIDKIAKKYGAAEVTPNKLMKYIK